MPPSVPRATYRLQLHRGFTFCDVLSLVPYLADLGVSHLYLSPLSQAVMLDLRTKLYARLHTMPMAFFSRQRPGEAIGHVLNDVQGVGDVVSGTLADIAQNTIVLASTILFMMVVNLVSATVVKERERGTLEQIFVTPLTSSQYLPGKMVP